MLHRHNISVLVIAMVIVLHGCSSVMEVDLQPKQSVNALSKEQGEAAYLLKQIPILDRVKNDYKNLPAIETVRKSREFIDGWDGAYIESVCTDSQEHFHYAAEALHMSWFNHFRDSFKGFINSSCFSKNYVAFIESGGHYLSDVEFPDNSAYVFGVYDIKKGELHKFNPQFQHAISMGDPGCKPFITSIVTVKKPYPVYFECLASTEPRGERPSINENAKSVYMLYGFDPLNNSFVKLEEVIGL